MQTILEVKVENCETEVFIHALRVTNISRDDY